MALSKAMQEQRDLALRTNVKMKQYTEGTGFPSWRKTGNFGVWNLWRDGVTSSFLDMFTTCREQTRLAYVEGLSGHSSPMGIEYGSCIHWILEQAYRHWGLEHAEFGQAVSTEYVESWVKQYEKVWLTLNPDPTTDQLQQQELIYGYAESVLPAYFRRWCGDFTGEYSEMANPTSRPVEFLSLEEEFRVPYKYPDGVTVWLRGKKDIRFRDKRGKKWIMDTKCLSIIKDEEIADLFPTDLQQLIYVLADLIDTNEMSQGSIKNINRRPGHRRSRRGGVEEPLRDFFARIKTDADDVSQWDMKDEKTTGWFVRWEMAMLESELIAWKRDTFDPLMQDVRDWVEGKSPHYATHKNATTKYGRCSMFGPLIKNDYSRVYKRERPFPELSA